MVKEKPERSPLVPGPPRVNAPFDPVESGRRDLVRRIVVSRSFARSERLSTLLKHVCEMTFNGQDTELTEQKIGQAVFGRSPEYDSSVDGIVRTQASRLRQRLVLYFEDEGMEEPVRLMIPKGGYVPVFAPRLSVEEIGPANSLPAGSLPARSTIPAQVVTERASPMRRMAPWILCALLAVALAVVLARQHGVAANSPSVPPHLLWSQMFSPKHATLEVPGDSGLVMFHRFNDAAVPLSEYLLGEFRSVHGELPAHGLASELKELRGDISNRRYTSIVDLDAAVTLAEIAQARQSELQVRYARDLRPNDLKTGNIIFLGAFEANPWIELFEPRMNFLLQDNYRTRVFTILNKAPHAGEPDHWESAANDPEHKVYGIVAYLPNLSGSGNALIVEGTAMAGTEAAWDFVSDDTVLLPFLKKIQTSDGRIPHFELLLGTQNMGSSAVRSRLLSWRLID